MRAERDRHVAALGSQLAAGGLRHLAEWEKLALGRIAANVHARRTGETHAASGESMGERLADRVAEFGGSWTFIGLFCLVLAVWTVANALVLAEVWRFDPYPFVFLNLVLSMLAAVQAPIILMSGNRAAQRDREAAARDYEVNIKAEIEIMALHEKLDALRFDELKVEIARVAAIVERMGDGPLPQSDAGVSAAAT